MWIAGDFISEQDLADQFGVTVHCLRAWRRRSYGPVARKLGRTVIYARDDVAAFLASRPNADATVETSELVPCQ